MLYRPRSDEVNEVSKGLYSSESSYRYSYAERLLRVSAGHTDLGSVTLLFRQPVAGLQILSKDGVYRWVKAVPGTVSGTPEAELT
jgi:isopenicillin N synthase-like dioxygenase